MIEQLELFNTSIEKPYKKGSLAERFGENPFSVLDAKQERWKANKKKWLQLGIKGEIGRAVNPILISKKCTQYGKNPQTFQEASVFDPYLCEILYKWFCPENGKILDPFAGGSVRGIVACKMGFDYTGIQIRDQQQINNKQIM